MLNATFNNISVMPWRSRLLEEETWVSEDFSVQMFFLKTAITQKRDFNINLTTRFFDGMHYELC